MNRLAQKDENKVVAQKIRTDLLEFAREEILPLIDIENIDVKDQCKKESDMDKRKILVAEENAFFIALKIFFIHDLRLNGGLDDGDIAIILGVTRARVSQIQANAEKKLKHPKFSRGFKAYVTMGNETHTTDF